MLRSRRLALAGALSSALLTAVPAPAQDCVGSMFWAAESLEARDAPREAVIADLNGDGLNDLAVAVYHLNSVQVSLRQPDGTYTSQNYGTAQGVGYQPDDLATGDIDGDSDMDLVVVNSYDRTFSVLKNGGTGLFTVTEVRYLGFAFGDLALGDLDGDGDLDLVSVGAGGGSKEFSVFLNTGGSFAWSRDYTVAGGPVALVLAQLDADGALDVAVTSIDDNSVSILWNLGTGVLGAPVRLPVLTGPRDMVAGDVDGDGRLDLVTAHGASGQVTVLGNQGGRNIALENLLVLGVRTDYLDLADVDQDGDLDLGVTGTESGAIDGASILLNDGTGGFIAAERFDVGDNPLSIAFGDLDGDGDSDVVVTNQGSDDLRLYTNRAGRMASASRSTLFGGPGGVEGITHGDLNGDGRQDLVIALRNQVQVLMHVGGAVFTPPVLSYPVPTIASGVAAGDVSGDGRVDVVVAGESTDEILVLYNSGGGLVGPARFPACDSPSAVVLRDMDGDQDLDAVVACFFGSMVKVLKNNGTGSFTTSVGVGWGISSSPYSLAVGDMDGDGDRDFVVGLHNSNLVAIGRNDGAFFLDAWSDPGCNTPESLDVADVNGDGRLDIAASCRLGARVRIYLNAGGGTFTLGATPLIINPLALKLADMDGDGDQDLVVVRGNTRAVAVFANDGAGNFTSSRDIGVDEDAWPLDVVDWDGDGDLDLATGGFSTRIATAVLNTRVGCPASAALSVAGGSMPEGDAGTASLAFNVALSTPVSWPVTVDYATADGTATAGSDYEATAGTLTFAPGEVQKTVVVTVSGDHSVETDETFWLDLSNAGGAPITTAQAGGTILNEDDGSATELLTLDLTSVEDGAGVITMSPSAEPCTVAAAATAHCERDFEAEATVTLVAEAAPGSAFSGWTGACTGAGDCVVSMTEARQVGASFLGPRTLTVHVASVEGGRGSVSLSPASLDGSSFCEHRGLPGVEVCTFQYAPDTPVSFTVGSFHDSGFLGWSGACTGTQGCQVFLAGPGPGPVVEAAFLGPRTLTVQVTSVEGGRGSVSVSPLPLSGPSECDSGDASGFMVCTFQYAPDTPVALSLWTSFDSKFIEWSGACTGSAQGCVVPLAGPGPGPFVDASFLGPRTLTVQLTSIEGGRGSVSVSPAPLGPVSVCEVQGGSGGQVCTFQFPPDTPVALTAAAFFDSKFIEWSGACTGAEGCVVPLAGPGPGPFVDASFLGPRTVTVQLTSVEGGRGTVWVSPQPLGGVGFCELQGGSGVQVCTFEYPPDTPVALTASAFFDSKFIEWSGACTGAEGCVVPLSAPGPGPFVDASFLGPRTVTVQLTSVEGGRGSVSVSPAPLGPVSVCELQGGSGVQVCTFEYPPDTPVALSASAFSDSKFIAWSGACMGAEGCVVPLSGPGPGPFVDASFLGPRTVTVQLTGVEGGRGSVSVSPAPLGPVSVCELQGGSGVQVCTFEYPPDTPVALTASAFSDSKFIAWSGACMGAEGCVVPLSAPGPGPFVDASFLGPRTVTVQLTGVEGGRGIVSVSPAPLGPVSVCELQGGSGVQVCTFEYPPDTPVALSASAFSDSKFIAWSGACTGAEGCVVPLSGPGPGPFVDASFLGPRTVTVQLTSVEGGRGSVSVSPAPLGPVSVCELQGGSGVQVCAFQYPPDTQVTFAVAPFVDSKFNGWSGACMDPLPGPCQVFLAGPGPGPTVEGSFLGPRDLALSIVSSRGGRGSLAVQPASLSGAASCELPVGAPSAACAFQYAPTALVTVTALPEPGSVVRDFGGSCPPQGPCTFFMSTAASVSVVFEIPNRAPTAHAGGPYTGVRGQAIVFNGSGSTDPDGDSLTYQWNFGDGTTGTGVAPSHAYASLGSFVVSLVVSDGELSSAPSTASVTIANLAPVVSLTSPADGSVHPASAPISLQADAVDADGLVVRVEYYAGAAKVGEAFSPPYTASWTGMAAGDYVLTAQATDDSGTTTTSAPRLVHVNPSPAVGLTAPASGAIFVAPATVALAATASDDGAVVAVEFYQGSTLLGVDATSPYTFNWTSVPAGRFVLTARAVDNVGGATLSAPVTIDVVTVVAPVADSSVRENNANSNFGNSTALDVRVTTNASNRWTYLRFNIGSLASIQAAKLRLFGNLSSTTTTAVQTRVFSSTNVTWGEGSITWNNKPAPGATVLASTPLVNNSTAARWYEWDLTAFLQAERAAGRTAVTLVLRNDVATPNATFRSRQASSNRPELRITP